MKIIAMANGGFALPTLKLLRESSHELCAVFAMPLRANPEKGKKAGIPPIRQALQDFLANVPCYEPENVNAPDVVELIRSLNADLIFICDYGRILSSEVICATKYGGLNLHGSLLPKYRGAAPINRAIQAGERELGVSVIFIEPKVDSGPIVARDSYIPTLNDTAIEIEEHLAELGAPLVLKAIDQIANNTIQSLPQSDQAATKAPKLKKEEGRIDWNLSSSAIIDLYRAFQPWPRVFADWSRAESSHSPVRLILGPFCDVDAEDQRLEMTSEQQSMSPGQVIAVNSQTFWIRTGDGAVRSLAVQAAGKKNMETSLFLRGFQICVGDKLS
ncbi:MAG: methionyl-tRNA formyltransferase [Planctomycetia bacterium]|nr:methionyl-tRNA formyltransferase [Planctomycetia bacterium]